MSLASYRAAPSRGDMFLRSITFRYSTLYAEKTSQCQAGPICNRCVCERETFIEPALIDVCHVRAT
jgi:hypothetical protein